MFFGLFVGGIHSLHDLAMPSLREPPPSWRRMLPAVWRWVMMGWRDDRKAPPEDVNHLWMAWRNMVSCFILYTLKEKKNEKFERFSSDFLLKKRTKQRSQEKRKKFNNSNQSWCDEMNLLNPNSWKSYLVFSSIFPAANCFQMPILFFWNFQISPFIFI